MFFSFINIFFVEFSVFNNLTVLHQLQLTFVCVCVLIDLSWVSNQSNVTSLVRRLLNHQLNKYIKMLLTAFKVKFSFVTMYSYTLYFYIFTHTVFYVFLHFCFNCSILSAKLICSDKSTNQTIVPDFSMKYGFNLTSIGWLTKPL